MPEVTPNHKEVETQKGLLQFVRPFVESIRRNPAPAAMLVIGAGMIGLGALLDGNSYYNVSGMNYIGACITLMGAIFTTVDPRRINLR